MKILIIFISIFFLPASLLSQVVETNPPNDIKTINFGMSDDSFGVPIVGLDEMLILEFDVLNNLEEDFYYVIEHYNYDWTPSQLMKTEYINGMDNLRIVDYINSFNTYQIYSHYQLKIPNQQTRLKVSGNYLIKIFDDYGDLVFSRKFMVQEKISKIQVQVRRPREVSLINEAQSVDFKVSSSNINFNNPMQTVKTAIIQNNNLKTAIYGLKPQFIMGNELVYRFIDESLFMGGNEYLFFENRDVRSANQGVQYIDLKEIYHSYLFTDIQRKYQKYTYNPDINGGFKITVLDREDPRIEADYTYVHFSLLSEEIVNSSVYVFGGFNNFSIDKSNQMSYNFQKGIYEVSIMLKQGFYNYKYVVVDKKNDLQEGFISGNFDETENNYVVVVYYRDLGSRYDKLIGIGSANSVDMTN
tara:strand:- start:25177 stop:26418 length:1242 start_codon:yes stop_codon:yes gene_type:complete